MNLMHMKYALAIAETHSINKAAEELFVGAPALSRAIKELEASLGATLFERSPRGMFLTPDGVLFVQYAKQTLKQIDDIETLFKSRNLAKERFSIAVPRASYVAKAIAEFSAKIDPASNIEIFYKETNTYRVIHNVLEEDYKLGILRYGTRFDDYFKNMMKEKNLSYDLITEFSYVLLMSKDSPLASKEQIAPTDLNGYIEINHADPYVPSLPISEVKKAELPEHEGGRIFVFERSSQFELLSKNPRIYMLVSSIPQDLLDRYGLVERELSNTNRRYKDVLIRKSEYRLKKLDRMFIDELIKAKRETFGI